MNRNNVGYLDRTRNNTNANNVYNSKSSTQDFDLSNDAKSRGKNVTNSTTTVNIPRGGTFLGGFPTGSTGKKTGTNSQQNGNKNYVNDGTYRNVSPSAINSMDRQTIANGTMKGTSGLTPTAINNVEKAQNYAKDHPYGQVKVPTRNNFLGGYTGSDVTKDLNISKNTSSSKGGSIFENIFGRFIGRKPNTINKNNTTTKGVNATADKGDLEKTKASSAETEKEKTINRYQEVSGKPYKSNYTTEDVEKLASLIYREAGGSFIHGSDEEWRAFLNSGAVALNNAYDKGVGANFSDKLTSLSNNVYQGLSSYATSNFDTVTNGASEAEKADLKYAAELILSGQYTLPKNMHLQASGSIVNNNGTAWDKHEVDHDYGYGDIYIGYDTGSAPASTDIYGNTTSTNIEDYTKLAKDLKDIRDSGATDTNGSSSNDTVSL